MAQMASGCPHCGTGGFVDGRRVVCLAWDEKLRLWHCVICGYLGDGESDPNPNRWVEINSNNQDRDSEAEIVFQAV